MKSRRIKFLLILFVFDFCLLPLKAQIIESSPSGRPINNIYLNAGGDASLISINYDLLLVNNSGFFLTTKIGLGYNSEFNLFSDQTKSYLVIPYHITGNIGHGNRYFEMGFGGSLISGGSNNYYVFYPILGYRRQPENSNKNIFRIFVSIPLGSYDSLTDPTGQDILFIPYGISLGRVF